MTLSDILNEIQSRETCLYLVHKVNKKNKEIDFNIVNPSINEQLKDELKHIVTKEIEKHKDDSLDCYNPIGDLDNTVETANAKEYNSIQRIKTAMKKPKQKYRFNNSSFDFFMYVFPDKDNDIIAFRRIRNFKVFKKGFIGNLVDGNFKNLENQDLLGTDDSVDFVIFDDNIFIFNHISFERVLDLRSEFYSKAESVLNDPVLSNGIKNFNKLQSAALSNQSYIKRLAKLGSKNNSTLFLEDISATKDVIKDFNLGIGIAGNKLVYEDESQVSSYIGLMQDAYYRTLIGKQDGVDQRR